MSRGLVVGKFAPLHLGHQGLIEHALAAVDELYLLIYDGPDDLELPLELRAGWLRRVFPTAHVIVGYDGPREIGREPRVRRLHEDYVRRMVPQPITHFFSSEWYGEHMSTALGAVDVRWDESRALVPVSGTLVRDDPYRWRRFVPPLVYCDLIRRIVFLGAESTGKSLLTEAVAKALGTVFVQEYGREYWLQHQVDGRLTGLQLVELAEGHLAREDECALEANRFLPVDTNALTTLAYAVHYHGRVEPELERLADACLQRYAVTFLCGAEIAYVEDGTRAGAQFRARQQQVIRADLARRGIPFHEVRGNLSERVAAVLEVLRRRWPPPTARTAQ